MREGGRAAPYLGAGFILLLVGLGGWGAFAHSLYTAYQQERALRDETARAVADRQKLIAELEEMRADLARTRQSLDRAQADLITARAEADLLKARPPQSPPSAPPPRTRQGR